MASNQKIKMSSFQWICYCYSYSSWHLHWRSAVISAAGFNKTAENAISWQCLNWSVTRDFCWDTTNAMCGAWSGAIWKIQ